MELNTTDVHVFHHNIVYCAIRTSGRGYYQTLPNRSKHSTIVSGIFFQVVSPVSADFAVGMC